MSKVVTRIALIVNPWAGIGGELAFKGSDGEGIRQDAIRQGGKSKVPDRISRFLECLLPYKEVISFVTFPSFMGEHFLKQYGFDYSVLQRQWQQRWHWDQSSGMPLSSSADTQEAAKQAALSSIDILVFAGGDGTARDISAGLEEHHEQVCLGIPCGVKIQSAVYARSPEAAADILMKFLNSTGVNIALREVRDIDEEALRSGTLASRYFSELLVPQEQGQFTSLQAGKQGNSQLSQSQAEKAQLVHEEIAAYLMEMVDDCYSPLLIVGAGHTTQAFKRQLGNEGSLLGVDVFLGHDLIAKDVNELKLFSLLEKYNQKHQSFIIVSVIGGQGCVLGRGSQPISPRVLNAILDQWGSSALIVLATEDKLAALPSQQLFVDTGNRETDKRLSGSQQVIVDYDRRMLCKLVS